MLEQLSIWWASFLLETPTRVSQATNSHKSRFKNYCQKIYRDYKKDVKRTTTEELDNVLIQLQKEISDQKKAFEQHCLYLHDKHKNDLELITTKMQSDMEKALADQMDKHKKDLAQLTHDF